MTRDWRRWFDDRPLATILGLTLLVHVIGIGWGLPASDGWDNDGIAPRDFLTGAVDTFTPGHYFTYPPVHLLLLTVLTLPVTLAALAHAPSFAPGDVVTQMIQVPYMTANALVARGVAALMSVAIVWAVAKMGEELRGRRAGLCAAAVCAVNAPLTYYAHTTNLDVPYLFWGVLALLALTRAIARREPVRLRRALCLAVLAIGTKDQAYGLFLLGTPAALLAWRALDPWAREHQRVILKELAVAVGMATGLLLVCDAIILNPTGFAARVRFLVGPASQDFVHYTRDALGRALAFRDTFLEIPSFYPAAFGALIALGLVLALRGDRTGGVRAAAMVPLFAILSFTLLFNCTALRTEHRFVLPQMILWSVYAGLALDLVAFRTQGLVKLAARAALLGMFALATFRCADVDANMLLDPRYDAEAWLAQHVNDGDTIETYGLNVYLPRFPARARTSRVGPPGTRNPLPGVTEVTAPFGDAEARGARFLVVSERWAGRYLAAAPDRPGYVKTPGVVADQRDTDATGFFGALFRGARGFTPAYTARFHSDLWPRVDIHGSLGCEVWIFERR